MNATPSFRSNVGNPLVVNFGGGVDSTAILVGLGRLVRAGDESARPALVLFADTGDEIASVYDNVRRMSEWCVATFGVPVTIVSRPANIPGTVGYRALSENCITNETLPGEAFGRGNCSAKWKAEPMDAFLFGRKRPARVGWLDANGFAGRKPLKLIGYDADEAKGCGKRATNAKIAETDEALFRYPLVEWGWTRQDCIDAIVAEGLPEPSKSACWLCPNQTPDELRAIAATQPELLVKACAIEEIARRGKNGLQIEGLWRRTRKSDGRPGSWFAWATREALVTVDAVEAFIAAAKPALANAPAAVA